MLPECNIVIRQTISVQNALFSLPTISGHDFERGGNVKPAKSITIEQRPLLPTFQGIIPGEGATCSHTTSAQQRALLPTV
jgi:hypothetical protein